MFHKDLKAKLKEVIDGAAEADPKTICQCLLALDGEVDRIDQMMRDPRNLKTARRRGTEGSTRAR